jgi:RND family efflux transporter MFP subunit
MTSSPQSIKQRKSFGIQRFQRLLRIFAGIGLVLFIVIGAVALANSRASHSTKTTIAEASQSNFSAEAIKSNTQEFFKYLTTFKSLLEPAPLPSVNVADQAVPVRVFVVGSVKPGSSTSSLTGVVRARHELDLAFRVNGKIRQRHVEVGQSVAKGTPLFDLDPEDFGLQLRTAQANLDVAEATVQRTAADAERAKELRRVNANSESEYEKVQAERAIAVGQRESALKQLELARNQLLYCRLSADESGVITAIFAEAGQVVTAGFRVAQLAQTDELEAVIDIPENRIPSERPKDSIVRFWSLPNVFVPAKLREISPVADSITRTFRSRFTLMDPPREVKLGMTATVEWSNTSDRNNVSIPASAIFERDNVPMVWLVDLDSGSISAKSIRIALVGDREVVVSDGLVAGQTIVSAGVQKLDEKLRVRVWESLP